MSQGTYSFLPFVRKGFGALIPDTYKDGLGITSGTVSRHTELVIDYEATFAVPAGAPAIAPQTYHKNVVLYDSGYVTGIMADAIVKTTPLNEVRNFECNYLAAIDFYDEDLPWRYTPLRSFVGTINGTTLTETPTNKRNSKLRPWISLIVLKRNEFSYLTTEKNPAIRIPGSLWESVLPPATQTWAWAHVQYLPSADGAVTQTMLNNDVVTNSDTAISRLLCPRRLDPSTNYVAFVVPTFEVGRLAGLGMPNANTDKQQAAWTNVINNNAELDLPYYHTWEFTTSGRFEDFESIIRKVKPKVLPVGEAGKRFVKIDQTGHPKLNDSFTQNDNPLAHTKEIYGLVSPATTTPPPLNLWTINPIVTPDGVGTFTHNLADLLNESNNPNPAAAGLGPDPIIGPPIYGSYHMLLNEVPVTSNNWFGQVNLDPTLRMMAGLGAEVVRQNQEMLMDIAWNQIGEVEKMNQVIAQLQLAQLAMQRIYEKSVANTNIGTSQYAAMYLAPLNTSILAAPGQTVAGQINGSLIPNQSFSSFFRKVVRPGGPIGRSINAASSSNTLTFVPALNNGTTSIAMPYNTPTGTMLLPAGAQAYFNTGFVANMPPLSNFITTQPGTIVYASTTPPIYNTVGASYNAALGAMGGTVQSIVPPPAQNPPLNWNTFMSELVTLVNPTATMLALAQRMFAFGQNSSNLQRIDFVMATPRIPFSIAQGVAALGLEYLMPGMGKLEQNGAYMLSPNQQILEALMLGANYEMNRELLWRGYPTDQRGTPLRHFWGTAGMPQVAGQLKVDNDPKFMDIKNIHQWLEAGAPSELGKNTSRSLTPGNTIVMALRSELFKKYPNTNVYMQKAKWQNGKRVSDTSQAAYTKKPIFYCPINPDMVFIGFDISPAVAKGDKTVSLNTPGWFLTFEERIGEPVFGADEEKEAGIFNSWDLLSWQDINGNNFDKNHINVFINVISPQPNPDNISWGSNSADMAYAMFQKPTCVFIHSNDMI